MFENLELAYGTSSSLAVFALSKAQHERTTKAGDHGCGAEARASGLL